ncbi:hypothetical protein PHISCL_06477 [Aspergillus sclerotialis]|uniref:Methylated-DNA--protein-cysteine methyltransferase n=1 Tax=Aspergillus sclerotialis TaxID=2070753 RepID=A0A3A2ZW02_9EURO|nr:hypothetical protein PHISCL_06477 [Aspergillus sclerotialis]
MQEQDKLDIKPHTQTKPKTTTLSKLSTSPPQKQPTINPVIQKSLHRISLHPTLTPYRRRVYRVLLSVPPGRWTTYSALAKYLGSSARAVGNAMRTNPFAPDVPCHRVLAADGTLGGYKGIWEGRGVNRKGASGTVGEQMCKGRTRDEKIQLLMDEGVVFDSEGRATGNCFGEFCDLSR